MRLLLLLTCFVLTSCATSHHRVAPSPPTSSFFTTSDGKKLPLHHWNLQAQPQLVLIGLHGIEGAGRDYRNLGRALADDSPDTSLYALNLRGAGYDPDLNDQGDIASPQLWVRDLQELNHSLRIRHPQARFLWIGESMGSLIALHALDSTDTPPDGLILVSPVISLKGIPAWQVGLLKGAAFVAPRARVSLQALAGGSFQATTNSEHFQQSATNNYHVDRYSLRYLRTLAQLSTTMGKQATKANRPVLILHGGKDPLTSADQITEFANAFPQKPQVREFKDSHHLLFYDKNKKEVIASILDWTD